MKRLPPDAILYPPSSPEETYEDHTITGADWNELVERLEALEASVEWLKEQFVNHA